MREVARTRTFAVAAPETRSLVSASTHRKWSLEERLESEFEASGR
jgi:hypothetical protein